VTEYRGWKCTNDYCNALNWHFGLNFIEIGKEYIDRCTNTNCMRFHIVCKSNTSKYGFESFELKEGGG
jgi:hypothetical protein